MISFENIRTGEKVTFTAEQDPLARQAHMAAYLNSSDLGKNASRGQDFGWRLAPEIVAEMEKIQSDLPTLQTISRNIGVGVEDVKNHHILSYMAEQRFNEEALKARNSAEQEKYEKDYQARLEKIREEGSSVSEKKDDKMEKQTTTKKGKK